MAASLRPDELVMPLLLVKAVLALLAVVLFLHYRYYWGKAKRHLDVHFFYTKWRAVRHAFILGLAAIGFAAGFSLELFGQSLGLGPTAARFVSSVFEAGSLFCILYVFFTLSLEDVPHFQHMAEASRHRHPQALIGHEKRSGQQLHAERKGAVDKRKKR